MLNFLFIYFSLCMFAKFLMSFLKAQVTFPSNFASIFSAIRHNSSVLFLAQTYFWSKTPTKEQFFKIFKWSSQNSLNSSYQFWNDKSIPLQILHYSSFSWHLTPLQILRSYFFYFGQNNLIKVRILTLFNFSSKFAYLFSVMKDNSSVIL